MAFLFGFLAPITHSKQYCNFRGPQIICKSNETNANHNLQNQQEMQISLQNQEEMQINLQIRQEMQINLQNRQEMQINLQNHREMQILICKIMSANANYSPPPRAKYVASIVKSDWAEKPENRFFALVSTGPWVLDCKRLSPQSNPLKREAIGNQFSRTS